MTRDGGTHFTLPGRPRYTKGKCLYCGHPIHGRARVCSAHRDLVIHDPLDARYRIPKDGKP